MNPIRAFAAVFCFIISTAAHSGDKPNILLLCIDDLRPELGCYGVDYIQSPSIDRLAASGRIFGRHYVQAPTCGASRYTLLTGTYGPADNSALFKRAKSEIRTPSLPAYFKERGYVTASVGKVSHHPGGFGGADWNKRDELEMPNSWDISLCGGDELWKHPRGVMHGLANGEIRKNAKDMDVFQAFAGPDTAYPDGHITEVGIEQLQNVSRGKNKGKPFFLAVGIIRPHLPFGAPAEYLQPYKDVSLPAIPHPNKPTGKTTWHGSGEFMKYNRWGRNPNNDPDFATEVRKHYAACVTYADAQVGRILNELENLGLRENTIIVLWGDHGWHLGEHGIWGKHALFEESLRSPLIISYPEIPNAGKTANAIVETVDLFPTLCDLTSNEKPPYLDGNSLLPLLDDPSGNSDGEALSYKSGVETLRNDTHRLIRHKQGVLELYDHRSGANAETMNLAKSNPELAEKLKTRLDAMLEKRQ